MERQGRENEAAGCTAAEKPPHKHLVQQDNPKMSGEVLRLVAEERVRELGTGALDVSMPAESSPVYVTAYPPSPALRAVLTAVV